MTNPPVTTTNGYCKELFIISASNHPLPNFEDGYFPSRKQKLRKPAKSWKISRVSNQQVWRTQKGPISTCDVIYSTHMMVRLWCTHICLLMVYWCLFVGCMCFFLSCGVEQQKKVALFCGGQVFVDGM